uniref:BED-type domain-containing protein n=1 Tax=Cajanus cajan TaxID=3821 RepID=A0A151SL89_CAJCA|nr:hypothetical protein KK1_001724 [Cajanus cajan]
MKTDVAWKYDVSVDGDARKVRCKFCEKTFTGGDYRLKHHLAGTSKDVGACRSVPEDVKKEMLGIVSSLQQNLLKKSGDIEGIGSSFAAQLEGGDIGSQNLFKRKVSSQMTINKIFKKDLREEACQDIALFFYLNAIPFNAANSEAYKKMFESVARHGPGFDPPSYHEIRVKYLKYHVEMTNLSLDDHKTYWKKFGCTIMTDGWTDRRRRTILNFLVNSPLGTIFLKSIDASKICKTADKIFKMLDDVVEEVGEENVVHIVTDNAANYKAAGEMLMKKRTKLYWTPCAAHCIDLMLEDFEKKIPLHSETIASGRRITSYIYGRTSLIALLHKFTKGGDLIRPGLTHEKPAMGFIYEEMDRAKEKIQDAFRGDESSYIPLWEIIDQRWDKQLHRPLHAAGYYLNPILHYAPNFKVDWEVKRGFIDCMEKIVGDFEIIGKIDDQLQDFKKKKDLFGHPIAQRALNTKSPADWWESYGDKHLELQQFAIRVLSLTCSSSGCERNWSVFERVHTKKRNRLLQKTMNDVVYVMANSKLNKKRVRKEKNYGIEDLSSDDDWIVEENDQISDLNSLNEDILEVGQDIGTSGGGDALVDDLDVPPIEEYELIGVEVVGDANAINENEDNIDDGCQEKIYALLND